MKTYSNYVATFGNALFKVGFTSNTERRFRELQSFGNNNSLGVISFLSFDAKDKDQALLIERLLIMSFKHLKIGKAREYFSGDLSEKLSAIKQIQFLSDMFNGSEVNGTHRTNFHG